MEYENTGENLAKESQPSAGSFRYESGSRPLEGYTIKRGLGRGGFGEVYFAVSDAGKEVALKLVSRHCEIELRGVQQCLNLKHPNLLSIYDIRRDEEGQWWVIMEYVHGQRLSDVIAAHPDGMPPDQALLWLHQIGEALAYLHDHGVVHRDLKPTNIFCENGVVKLGDYGLSKFISTSCSGQTENIGTVHYMAPEIANGRYGKGVDIYALGVIFYEMLTGRPPFEGESVGEILMKHLTAQPDLERVPPLFRGVVARALEKEPGQRFRSVREMLAALPRPVGRIQQEPVGQPTSQPVASPVHRKEPIAAALTQLWRKIRLAWSELNINTPTKILLLAVLLFLLFAAAGRWVPILILLAEIYVVYFLIWALVGVARSNFWQSGSAGQVGSHYAGSTLPGGMASAQIGQQQLSRIPAWARRPLVARRSKPMQERLAELLGSMLLTAFVVLVVCFLIVALWAYRLSEPPPVESSLWFTLITVLCSWAVLIVSSFWEGRMGDAALRRFAMLAVGLFVGTAAFVLADTLGASLPNDIRFVQRLGYSLPKSFYTAEGEPRLLAYVVCFGTMFLLVRWWRLVDPCRSSRFRVWPVLAAMFAAWFTGAIWLFPQPWLMMIAVAMAIGLQLGSRWENPAMVYINRPV